MKNDFKIAITLFGLLVFQYVAFSENCSKSIIMKDISSVSASPFSNLSKDEVKIGALYKQLYAWRNW